MIIFGASHRFDCQVETEHGAFFLMPNPKYHWTPEAVCNASRQRVDKRWKIFSHSSMLFHTQLAVTRLLSMLSARPNWRSNCTETILQIFSFCLGEFPQDSRHDDMSVLVERTAEPVFIFAVTSCRQGLWLGGFILNCVNALGRGKTREDSKTLRQLKDRQWQVGESKSEKNSFEFELPALDSWPCQFVAFCCNSRFPSPAAIALASFLFPKAPIQSYLVSAILRMHIGIHWPYHHAVRLVSRSFAEVMAGGQSSKFFPYLRRSAFGISILPALLHRTGQATSGRPGLSDFGLRAWSKVWNSSMPLWKSLIYVFWYVRVVQPLNTSRVELTDFYTFHLLSRRICQLIAESKQMLVPIWKT